MSCRQRGLHAVAKSADRKRIEYEETQEREQAMTTIDFWFSVGSTYSYLSLMRLAQVEQEQAIEFVWHPFSVRVLMREMDNIPFSTKPIKASYMWRDLARRAAMYDVPIKVPAPYPLKDFDLANRVAVLGTQQGWCREYVLAAYRHWFQQGREPSVEPALSAILEEIGLAPEAILEAAQGDAVGQAYEQATNNARALGIFGVPTFIVNGEMFWGDDRLEDALSWSKHGRVLRHDTKPTV
jgi:2-hydroxychromene-2-carboxylate isomerase